MAADDSNASYVHMDLESMTTENQFFRMVDFTVPSFQLVLMCLMPGEEIKMEVHPHNVQFFYCEGGRGEIHVRTKEIYGENINRLSMQAGNAAIINPGTWHRVINPSKSEPFQFFTIYTPAHHPADLVQEYP